MRGGQFAKINEQSGGRSPTRRRDVRARRLVYDFAQRTGLRSGRDDGDADADFLRDGHQRLLQSWETFFPREVPEGRSLSATCGLGDLFLDGQFTLRGFF